MRSSLVGSEMCIRDSSYSSSFPSPASVLSFLFLPSYSCCFCRISAAAPSSPPPRPPLLCVMSICIIPKTGTFRAVTVTLPHVTVTLPHITVTLPHVTVTLPQVFRTDSSSYPPVFPLILLNLLGCFFAPFASSSSFSSSFSCFCSSSFLPSSSSFL